MRVGRKKFAAAVVVVVVASPPFATVFPSIEAWNSDAASANVSDSDFREIFHQNGPIERVVLHL